MRLPLLISIPVAQSLVCIALYVNVFYFLQHKCVYHLQNSKLLLLLSLYNT